MHELEKRADQHRLQALSKISAMTQELSSGEESSPEDKQSLAARMAKKIEKLRNRFSS
jgi:hypothetical protein